MKHSCQSVFCRCAAVLLFVSVLGAAPAPAQQPGGWLTVDYAVLLAFHPGMFGYDFAVQRFYRADVPLGDKAALKKFRQKATQIEKKYHAEIQELNRKQNKLLKTMCDAEEAHIKEVNRLLRDGKSVASAKKAFNRRENERNKALENINKEYEKIRDKSLNVYYLPKEESDKLFLSIMGEIDAIIKQISREYDNAVIIDRSYLAPASKSFVPPVAVSGFDQMAASVYAQLLKTDFSMKDEPRNAKTPPGHLKNVAAGIEERFQQQLQRVLTQVPSLRPVIANVRPNLFLCGGQDVTVRALKEIFKQKNVAQEAADRIIKTLPYLQ